MSKTSTLRAGQELVIGSDERRVLVESIDGRTVKLKTIAPEHVHVRKTTTTTPAPVGSMPTPDLVTTS